MNSLKVEPLSRKFSIAKDHLWCIYDGDQPLFCGSMNECREWLDWQEATEFHFGDSCEEHTRSSRPRFRFFQWLIELLLGKSRRRAVQQYVPSRN